MYFSCPVHSSYTHFPKRGENINKENLDGLNVIREPKIKFQLVIATWKETYFELVIFMN